MKNKIILLTLGASLFCVTQCSLRMKKLAEKEKLSKKILEDYCNLLVKPSIELTEYFIKFNSKSIASLDPLEKNKKLSELWQQANNNPSMMKYTNKDALVGYMRYHFKESFGKELQVKNCLLQTFGPMVLQELQDQEEKIKDLIKTKNHNEK